MESFARLLIAIPLVSYVLAVLSLWVSLQINSFIFPIAVCISVLWECSDKRIRGCVRWTTTVAVLVVLSVTLGLSACIYDRSFDGQWYHACTIRELVNGWNPIYSSACSPTPIDGYTVLWVEHYPRGIETIAATIVSCMGNLDAGKALNLWFVFSSIVYIYLFLCYCLPTMNKYLRIWVALVVALNPVVINQMCTYYIDWTLYTLLVIFLINMYLFFVKGIQRALHIDLLLLFFIPAIKINIFFDHNVDRHVFHRIDRLLKNDVIAQSFHSTISLQSRTLPDQIMHITGFQQFHIRFQKVIPYQPLHASSRSAEIFA